MSFNNWSLVVLQLYEFSNLLSYNRAFLATLCVHDIVFHVHGHMSVRFHITYHVYVS